MNYATIKWADVANGPGVRVSLFVSGCTHHCPGCFNEEAWDFCYGNPFTPEVEDKILEALAPSYLKGLSLLGGEPFEPANQASGYTLDGELWQDSRARCEHTDEMLSLIDVLVDGRFVEELKDLNLRFRGSANQRIIDVPSSLKAHQVVEWKGEHTIQPIQK